MIDHKDLLNFIYFEDEEGLKEYLVSQTISSEFLNQYENAMSALEVAIESENVAIVKLLLEAGASVTQKDSSFGMTALHLAASNNQKDCVQLLIAAGSDLNETDKSGFTALHFAMTVDALDVVRLLLEHGADLDIIDTGGKSAREHAKSSSPELAAFVEGFVVAQKEQALLRAETQRQPLKKTKSSTLNKHVVRPNKRL